MNLFLRSAAVFWATTILFLIVYGLVQAERREDSHPNPRGVAAMVFNKYGARGYIPLGQFPRAYDEAMRRLGIRQPLYVLPSDCDDGCDYIVERRNFLDSLSQFAELPQEQRNAVHVISAFVVLSGAPPALLSEDEQKRFTDVATKVFEKHALTGRRILLTKFPSAFDEAMTELGCKQPKYLVPVPKAYDDRSGYTITRKWFVENVIDVATTELCGRKKAKILPKN